MKAQNKIRLQEKQRTNKKIKDLLKSLEEVKARLQMQKEENEAEKTLFTIEQLIEFLPQHPKRSTIYKWVSLGKIPFHKIGKNLVFKRTEIIQWMSNKIN